MVQTALLLILGAECHAQTPAADLARILRDRQIISSDEFDRVISSGPSLSLQQLADLLRAKGVISPTEASMFHAAGEAPVTPWGNTPAPVAPSGSVARSDKPAEAGSDSNRKLTFYGTLLFNAYFNTGGSNNADIPSFATQRSAGPQENFGATARQTRLGLSYSGLTTLGANVGGTVEADFFGGVPALTNGINMDVVRLRLAYGRLDWKHFAIEAGQDWAIFAPLNPTSLAEFAIPEFAGSGNLWIRTPQIRTEWSGSLSGGAKFLWQMAALDPDIGDNPATFSTARQPRAGELGRLPAVESRVAISAPLGDRTATIGISGHWGAAKNTLVVNQVASSRSFESWGVATDYSLPVSRLISITGEVYAGKALGVFSGGIGQTVQPLGQVGDNGVGARGGWLQLQLNLTKQWQANAAYGIDAPSLGNLSSGGRAKNQSYMGNIAYRPSAHVALALEWRRFLTNYLNQTALNNVGNHVNLAAAYTF